MRALYSSVPPLPYPCDPWGTRSWNLDSALTLDPPVHFVAFVPSAARSPLHLRLPGGRLSAEGAFLVPGWGGLALAHVPNATDPESEARAALRSAMPIFVGQLRLLLGLPPLDPALSPCARSDAPPAPPARLLTCPEAAICDWEIDVLARGRAAAAAAAAAASLRSLTALVDQQKNMVVGDHIRNLCDLAVEQLRDARAAVASLDPRAALSAALSAARRALVASRDAFFDPTMLGMMYFSDERKAAVYIPIALPVAIPIVTGFLRQLRYRREKRRRKAAEAAAKAQDDAAGGDAAGAGAGVGAGAAPSAEARPAAPAAAAAKAARPSASAGQGGAPAARDFGRRRARLWRTPAPDTGIILRPGGLRRSRRFPKLNYQGSQGLLPQCCASSSGACGMPQCQAE
eukprot:tig00000269_g23745.t1